LLRFAGVPGSEIVERRTLDAGPAGRHGNRSEETDLREGMAMLRWALLFLVIALIAGALGLWGLEGTAMWVARVLFVVFLILFVVSLVMGRRAPPV
jgi:uncharacterized membrane protein YtjA (UPF0391 family)